MGGRGSFFKHGDYDKKEKQTIEDVLSKEEDENFMEDVDTELEHEGYTKKLLKKNIHIKQSTDGFKKDVLIPNIDKIDKLTNKYLGTVLMLNNNKKELTIRADKMKPTTRAYFKSYADNLQGLRIVFNKDTRHSTREVLESFTKEQIDSGQWVKCDKENLVNHTITHEFGHFIQRVLMQKEQQTEKGKRIYNEFKQNVKLKPEAYSEIQDKYFEDHARRVLTSIDNIQYKYFKHRFQTKDTSRYGRTNFCETFAETFAELNNNKEPSTLAKSMEIYLGKHIK